MISEEMGVKLESITLKDLGKANGSPSTRTTPPSSRVPETPRASKAG